MSPIKRRLRHPREDDWESAVVQNINILHDSIDLIDRQLGVIMDAYASIEVEQGRLANCIRELKLKVKR
jgi:hypothetical protein